MGKIKISDKADTVNDNFNVYMYDNGFMFEISGRDSNGDWITTKIVVHTLEELTELVSEAVSMKRD